MSSTGPSKLLPEWAPPRDGELDDLIGAAMYICPPGWASDGQRDRAAQALCDWSAADEEFLHRGWIVAHRQLRAGRLRRDVVRLIERAVEVAHTDAEPHSDRAGARMAS
jgi:hypothetical protein